LSIYHMQFAYGSILLFAGAMLIIKQLF